MFPGKVVRPWDRLPRKAVAAPSLELSKARLDAACIKLGQWNVSLPMAGGWNWMDFKVPSNTNQCGIL